MIRLEKVTEKTFRKVLDMKLTEPQNKYVAPNVVSLAQAWLYYDAARPLAVCDEDEVVGFMMLDWDEEERTVGVWRFMIAAEHQHKGYGKEALKKAIDMAKEDGNFDAVYLDYVKGNDVARSLYYSLGFRENGEEENNEIVMVLPLTDDPKVGMLTADEEDVDDFLEILQAEEAQKTVIPESIRTEEKIRAAVDAQQLRRFTILGKTIGFSVEEDILVETKSSKYLDEVKVRNQKNR